MLRVSRNDSWRCGDYCRDERCMSHGNRSQDNKGKQKETNAPTEPEAWYMMR